MHKPWPSQSLFRVEGPTFPEFLGDSPFLSLGPSLLSDHTAWVHITHYYQTLQSTGSHFTCQLTAPGDNPLPCDPQRRPPDPQSTGCTGGCLCKERLTMK